MAVTVTFPVLGGNTNPSTSGNVFWEPLAIRSTTTIWKHGVWTFSDTTTKIHLYFTFRVPQNYTASTQNAFLPSWTANATTGQARWGVQYRAISGDNSELYNSTSAQQSVEASDAAPGAAWRQLQPTIAVSSGNFAAGDVVQGSLFRDGSNSTDTLGVRAHVFDLAFRCQVTT